MKLSGFVRPFKSLILRFGTWMNESHHVRPDVIAGLERIHRCAKILNEPSFLRRHCDACEKEKLFSLWYDDVFHCLSDIYRMPQGSVNVGCMACRTMTVHMLAPSGDPHCYMCWSRRMQLALTRQREAAMPAPATEAEATVPTEVPATPAAAASGGQRTRTRTRNEDSFLGQLPS